MSRESDEKRELLKLKQGIIDDSEIIQKDVHEESEKPKGIKWLENFMYRNKFYVLFGAFLIIAGVIMTYQLLNREASDMTVLLVTSDVEKTPGIYQKVKDIETGLEQYCPDYDGNGNVHVDVYFIDLTKTADMNFVNSNSAKFYGEIERGVAELFICDNGIFAVGDESEEAANNFNGMFLDIGKITEDSKYDGMKTVRLKDTPLAKDAKWESSCPEALGICVRQEEPGMISYSEKALENNRKAQEVLRNILSGNKLHEPAQENSDGE